MRDIMPQSSKSSDSNTVVTGGDISKIRETRMSNARSSDAE